MPDAEMFNEAWNTASNNLFYGALIAYLVGMVGYFFRMAYTHVGPDGTQATSPIGRRVGLAATVVTVGGAAAHLVSIVLRGLAAGRAPWANMYEYSSGLAFLVVVIGLIVLQRRYGYTHVVGFVIALAVLIMAGGLMLYAAPDPLQPSLQSWWIRVHVSAAMVASSIFTVAFVATALYLVKDTAERRLAERSGQAFGGSTVGAANVDGPSGRPEDEVAIDADAPMVAPATAQREVLGLWPFLVVPAVIVAGYVLAVWQAPVAAVISGGVAALLGGSLRYAVPYLPAAAQLDNVAYRTVAFAFPIWTFAVIAGAIWAEEAWGRYWGWDPKETASFVTWVFYAGYLHARATRGWRGRGAAWIGVVSFIALVVTFYAVNLFVVGLHSYAGV
ncbi:c-type cytochrome biogenesis protein CcsB [Egibacter rhizosphaerae]|nr:c-type cytochrome biogenesis protein CcsB [Egibacter rhizosphaerae]